MLAGDNGGCDCHVCVAVLETTVGEKQQETNESGCAWSLERCNDSVNPSGNFCNIRVVVSAGDNGGCDSCVCFTATEITVAERCNNKLVGLVNMRTLRASEDVATIQTHTKMTVGEKQQKNESSQYGSAWSVERCNDSVDPSGIS